MQSCEITLEISERPRKEKKGLRQLHLRDRGYGLVDLGTNCLSDLTW